MDERVDVRTNLDEATPVILASDERQKRKQKVADEQEQIRKRIRETKAPSKATLLPADPQPTIDDGKHMRVAAYTRVSTSSTEQISSIEYQRKWYEEMISKNPNWEICAIYSDEGKSGTSMKKRPEFRRMIQDASDGEIDLIVCASVSRFARNVSDCIEQTDILKTQDPTHPVGVYFESENIYTLNSNSNQAFQMHSLLADWESATKSARMILSYDQRITLGQYPVADLLGFRHTKDGQLIIHPEEAKTVKYIFYARLLGHSLREIAEVLTEKHRPSLTGKTIWDSGMVSNIMKNERRWGYLIARKVININYKLGKTTPNTYIKDGVVHHHRCGAFVEDHHEGIVSPSVAKAAGMVAAIGIYSGISELIVITSGALKGFVNIAPGWNAVNGSSFIDACSCVYTDEEYAKIAKETAIRTGMEHSSVVSMAFHDYEVPHSVFFINKSTANITLSKSRIKISKTVIDRFGENSFIEILYHPVLQILAFRSCSSTAPNAIPLWADDGKPIQSIPAPGLCRSIFEHMDWIQSFRFRTKGVYRNRNGFEIMIFYLDETQILPDKETILRYKSEENADNAHYIPYRNKELLDSEQKEHNRFGIPVKLRMKRDSLINSITDNDIQAEGIAVENTAVGDLPTREEIQEELDRLLQSM